MRYRHLRLTLTLTLVDIILSPALITEWDVHITAQDPAPSPNCLYCVEWAVKP